MSNIDATQLLSIINALNSAKTPDGKMDGNAIASLIGGMNPQTNPGGIGNSAGGGQKDIMGLFQTLLAQKPQGATQPKPVMSEKLENTIIDALNSFCTKCQSENKYFQEKISMLKSGNSSILGEKEH